MICLLAPALTVDRLNRSMLVVVKDSGPTRSDPNAKWDFLKSAYVYLAPSSLADAVAFFLLKS